MHLPHDVSRTTSRSINFNQSKEDIKMAKQEVSAQQVQMAAAAGVTLLQVDDLPVPLKVAKSGALGVLEGMLQALASGEIVLAAPQPENITEKVGPVPPIAPVETPPQGDQPPANDAGANGDGGEPSAEG